MATEIKYQITNGPCKLDLMLAHFVATNANPHPLVFTLEGGPVGQGPYTLYYRGGKREDGSGESFMIEAVFTSTGGTVSRIVTGYYCTRTRTGYLSFTRE